MTKENENKIYEVKAKLDEIMGIDFLLRHEEKVMACNGDAENIFQMKAFPLTERLKRVMLEEIEKEVEEIRVEFESIDYIGRERKNNG